MEGSSSTMTNGDETSILRAVRRTYMILVGLYVLTMMWVWAGIFLASGDRYVDYGSLLAVGFVGATAVVATLFLPMCFRLAEIDLNIAQSQAATLLMLLVAVLCVVHWLALGRIPIISAFETDDAMQAALIRSSIHQTGIPLLNYVPTVVVWSLVPFLSIYFIAHGQYRFCWLIMLIGIAYGLSLMQKSYPLIMLVPPGLYCLLTRRVILMLAIGAVAMAAVLVAFFAANPQYRPLRSGHNPPTESSGLGAPRGTPTQEESPSITEIGEVASHSLAGRVFLLPGQVVTDWFATFDAKLPYEGGCGYRFVAPFIGCSFVNTPERLYPLFYPEAAAAGVKGTYNAAHFAEEYVNFGPFGLLLSGVFISLVLGVSSIMTSRAGLPIAIAINFPAIMALSSAALHTTLLTGGWMFMMALAFVLYRPLPSGNWVALQGPRRLDSKKISVAAIKGGQMSHQRS